MKIAFITQSYKNDFKECKLLCDSIDRFVPEDIMHFIIVNDEDYKLFGTIEDSRHKLYKKGEIIPSYFVRFPLKIAHHHFYISPFTIPVREWIMQQICKLGVFEVIGDGYDAVFNIDSEMVFMRPLNLKQLVHDGNFVMYKNNKVTQPSHNEYYKAAKRLFKNEHIGSLTYDYMSTPVCFTRENLQKMLSEIASHSIFRNWKLALSNTYRFSENYLYGIFCTEIMSEEECNHFITSKRLFPIVDITNPNKEDLIKQIRDKLCDPEIIGICLQKTNRKLGKYIDFNLRKEAVEYFWSKNI